MKLKTVAAASALILLTGCASMGGMSHRDQSTLAGAALGGVAGAVVSDGSTLGTVGGAAVGGLIGNQLGRDYRDDRRRYDGRRYDNRRYDGRRHDSRRYQDRRYRYR